MTAAVNRPTLHPFDEFVILPCDSIPTKQELHVTAMDGNPSCRLNKVLVIFLLIESSDQPDKQSVFGDAQFLAHRKASGRVGFESQKVESIWNDLQLVARITETFMGLSRCF